MNNAAFTVGSVIMEFANSDAQIMQATHVRIAPHFSLAYLFAEMCWRVICLVNIVRPANQVYCSN